MNCDHALELLLEADLSELDGVGESPLAAHVRDCAKCRAVAAQVLADTRALALATGDRRVVTRPSGARRSYVRRPVAAAGALAAVLALAVFGPMRTDDDTHATVPAPGPAAPAATEVPRGVPAAARRFAEPAAATPMRLVASQSVTARATGDPDRVIVTAPEGTRVAVLKTGNPAITVVWLY